MSANLGLDAASTSQTASTGANSTVHQSSSKYRNYVSAVDKALKSFEQTTEWADLISALGKLSKSLRDNSKNFSDVPKSVIVAKRLSQCLHQALPSGVHVKALETYKQVFTILKRDNRMGKELYLYAIGLFPLMDHCGIKVKSELLTIFEDFILPMGDELKPALPGFIGTVLLGVEEGSEFFQRSLTLLDQLMEKIGARTFYTCLWEAVLHSPTVRLPALYFVNTKFDSRKPFDEQFSLIAGDDHADHMIAALCAVAEESSAAALVHRHLLDFLCAAFPLNSAHVTQADFVQLLRRCMFIVLRRDMSLTRRLYQWILNKRADNTTSMMPVDGNEDTNDITFFQTYSLPLIKLSMVDFLKLDCVEVPILNTVIGSVGGSYDGTPEHQTHFTEVRLCRALHYFLDRPHFGQTILKEILSIFLEYCCVQDAQLVQDFTKTCEEMDPGFQPDWAVRIENVNQKLSAADKARRIDEIKKNFNALLNNLEAGFLWKYLSEMFTSLLKSTYKNESDDDDREMTDEERQKRDFDEEKRKEHIAIFPVMVAFSLNIVQLDNHSDIRSLYLPNLLNTILLSISEYGCDFFTRDNLVALIATSRKLLKEINQSVSAMETGVDVGEDESEEKTKLAARNSTARKQQKIREQKLVEECLQSCYQLVARICQWYVISRDKDMVGTICAISTFLHEFDDFPIYCFQQDDTEVFCGTPSFQSQLPQWMEMLLLVVDVESWQPSVSDFDVRARIVDLMIYLYIRSTSLIEQFRALTKRDSYGVVIKGMSPSEISKTTMTVLLKPMLTEKDIRALDDRRVFGKVATVLWRALGISTQAGDHQVAAGLLHRLHSRNTTDLTSEVEDIILTDLTANDKDRASEACRRFRKLWTLTRILVNQDVYLAVPYKPFNKIIMVLLGQIGDDTKKNSSLKTIATAWFIDCAKHGDLPRVLQMLATMLVCPATARVSIQYMQIENRISKDTVKSMPADVNALTLVTPSGKQTFHHVCRDVSMAKNNNSTSVPVNCNTNAAWISDLKKQLLSPNGSGTPYLLSASTVANPPTPAPIKTHKRTVSDIPQFDDEDSESIGDVSMDSTVDPDIMDVVLNLVDTICEQFENQEHFDQMYSKVMDKVSKPNQSFVISGTYKASDRRSLPATLLTETAKKDDREEQSKSLLITGNENGFLKAYSRSNSSEDPDLKVPTTPQPQQPIIKRVKCGHRRQDSLQESIFSSGANELKLFDPAELPKLTAPGDAKQPLLEEAQAHMLLYMESPHCVDLGRVQGIFRTLSSLIRSNRGANLGRMMIHCMVFNNTSILPQNVNGGICQLVEYLQRHYKAIQGEGFWFEANGTENGKSRHCSFFELYCTISLYFLRSYFLNSPIAPISEGELTTAWECKIAALDFFTDLLRELTHLVTETRSREFVNFILTIYRQTKLQRCLISFLLTAVPNPRHTYETLSVSADIAEFNSLPTKKDEFGDLAFAYHRALLDFASIVISLEYHMNMGLQGYSEQNLSLNVEKSLLVHKLNYNIPSNRGTLKEPRVLVVELKLFISVIVNALQKLPERHELWLQFLINVLPYCEKALPTICIHVVEQLCRNIDTCVNFAYGHVGGTTFDTGSVADETLSVNSVSLKKRVSAPTPSETYSENYALTLLEALTIIMHHCMLESPSQSGGSVMGGVVAAGPAATTTVAPVVVSGSSGSPTHSVNSVGATSLSSQNMPNSFNSGAVTSVVNMIPGTKGATEMIGNFFSKVFTSNDSSGNIVTSANKFDNKNAADIWRQARDELLKNLPNFLSTICDIWAVAQKNTTPKLPIGSTEELKARVYELINPLAKRHPNSLLNAMACVWMTRSSRSVKPDTDQPCFVYSDEQLALANLLLSLKVLPFQHTIYAVAECLKEQAKNYGPTKASNVVTTTTSERSNQMEVAMLEMLHGCARLVKPDDLHDCWSALNILFSEAPLSSMSPRGVFLEFKILDDFVRIVGSKTIIDDKQISRAIQDACVKLTDAVNTIVGWQLETTTWLKRTLVVRQDTGMPKSGETTPMMETKSIISSVAGNDVGQSVRGSTVSLATKENNRMSSLYDVSSGSSASQFALSSSADKKSSSNLRASIKDTTNNKKDPANSTQALFLLADCLAELIDSIGRSEDKEKLIPTLQSVWANTLPYLKAKSARNARFFLASSQFLASISSFSYMRSVWKKQTLELLFESSFFKMDIHSLKQWLIVIDNLMTNDKTSFKELLTKIPTGPNSTLSSLITSKDAELEMRAQSLKRLAFVVLSSQMEQYSAQLPDIQERLSDNLRLSQVPLVHAQVFACYRVLLVRMRSLSFNSMWPTMATELVQVLLQIENQLHQITGDSASMNNANVEDLKCSRDDQWMQLYLSACKLLETLCTLPSGYVSHFQTCHWAFISSLVTNSDTDQFVPFATRIHNLLSSKYGEIPLEEQPLHSASLQNIKTLSSFAELRPFFHALASQHNTVVQGLTGGGAQECFLHDASTINGTMTLKGAIAKLEHGLYVDFAEHLQL